MVHLAEHLRSHFRCGINGNTGLLHLDHIIDHEFLAGHAAENRLLLVIDVFHDIHKRAEYLPLNDHDKTVDIAAFHADVDQVLHLPGRHGKRTVNGIADTGIIGHDLLETFLKIRFQSGQTHVGKVQHVRRGNAHRTGISNNEDAVPLRYRLFGESAGQCE